MSVKCVVETNLTTDKDNCFFVRLMSSIWRCLRRLANLLSRIRLWKRVTACERTRFYMQWIENTIGHIDQCVDCTTLYIGYSPPPPVFVGFINHYAVNLGEAASTALILKLCWCPEMIWNSTFFSTRNRKPITRKPLEKSRRPFKCLFYELSNDARYFFSRIELAISPWRHKGCPSRWQVDRPLDARLSVLESGKG